MLKPLPDMFCRIEKIVTANPHLLDPHNYHTRSDGEEALTPAEITSSKTSHDLMGFIVALTPGAVALNNIEPGDLAQQILVAGGWSKIPRAIVYGEREDMLKLVKGRAAEERSLNGDKPR